MGDNKPEEQNGQSDGANEQSPEAQSNAAEQTADTASESGSSVKKVLQDQDFRKIRVVLDYDEEDRRGDPSLEEQPVQSESEDENDPEETVNGEEDGQPPAKKANKKAPKSDKKAAKGDKKTAKKAKKAKTGKLSKLPADSSSS